MPRLLSALFLLFLAAALPAQPLRPRPHFRHFGMEEGLPSPEVYQSVEDAEGRMWFVTDNGISRFDGYGFQNFSIREGLPESCILRIFKDSRGHIWLDALSRKIYRLDPEAGFPAWPFNAQKSAALKTDRYIPQESFFWWEEGQKMVFAVSSIGLLEMDTAGNAHLETGDGCGYVLKNYGGHWMVSSSSRACPPGFPLFDKITVLDGPTSRTVASRQVTGGAVKMIQLASGTLLLARGTDKSNPSGFLTLLRDGQVLADFPFDDDIHFMLEDRDQSLWFSMNDGGLRHYADLEALHNGQFETLLAGKSVCWVQRDRSGGLWATTLQDGVFYCPKTETAVISGLRPDGERDLVSALETVGDSVLFFSTFRGDVFQIRDAAGAVVERLPGRFAQIADLLWVPGTPCLFQTSAWGYAPVLSRKTAFPTQNGRQAFAGARLSLSNDGQNFFIPFTFGFHKINARSAAVTRFPQKAEHLLRCLDICQDPAGTIWAGTLDGLRFFENDSLKPGRWQHPALRARVEDIEVGNWRPETGNFGVGKTPGFSQHQNFLAIGTKGQGVALVFGDSVRQFTTDDGLVSNHVERLHIAPDGSVWACTLEGLSQILPPRNGHGWRVRSITVEEGLPSNEVSDVATFRGQTWAATAAGLVRLAPFLENKNSPAPFEAGIWAAGKKLNPGELAGLPPGQNDLQIRFRTLNFRMNGHIPYRYRLLPRGEWTATRLTEIGFSALPPGAYSFEVQSQNEDEHWSAATSVSFRILPPWYLTWWFRGLVFLTLCALAWAFYRQRVARFRRQLAMKQQLFDLERRALQAQMNPHFIFNCLNSIQNFISEGDKDNAMNYTAQFARLTRMVLDFSGKNSISLEDELEAMQIYLDLERLRAGNRFDFSVETSPGLDTFETELPPMLVQPFVENAVKHGNISRLAVIFALDGAFLKVTVRDNGTGIQQKTAAPKEHESKGIGMSRQRLGIWNGREAPGDLRVENLERGGVLVTLRILQKG